MMPAEFTIPQRSPAVAWLRALLGRVLMGIGWSAGVRIATGLLQFAGLGQHRRVLRLQAMQQLSEVDAARGAWLALGADPQFLVMEPYYRVPRGWCCVDGRAQPGLRLRLYVDTGAGYDESDSHAFDADAQGCVHGIVHLPLRTRGLRLDPADRAGAFELGTLALTRLPWREQLAQARAHRSGDAGKPFKNVVPMRRTGPLPIGLRPAANVARAAEADAWLAQTDDPQFIVQNSAAWPRGWLRLRGRISAGPRAGTPKLYFDIGAGFSEASACALRYAADWRGIDQVIFVPPAARAIRFDPLETAGAFELGGFTVEGVGVNRSLRETGRALRERSLRQAKRGAWALLQRFGLRLRRTQSRTIRYEQFLRLTEPQDAEHHAAVRSHIEAFERRPLISVILPAYNTPPQYLRAAVASVQAQLYPHWELCLVDDASPDAQVRATIRALAAGDARIRHVFREENGGIVAASNSALALAQGEFVAFLDHDDLLSELALYYVAAALDQDPALDVIYTDEDKIDERGCRYEPHFKPDWNPELLLSNNYIAHLAVYRRALVESVGRLSQGTDGSQDFDLVLRCTAASSPERIHHIPATLYHWRSIRGSTARAASAKGYTHAAGVRALQNRLRQDEGVTIGSGAHPNMYRVRFALPAMPPKVSIIIPTRDGGEHLRTCLASLRRLTRYPSIELILVDNQTLDPATLALLDEQGRAPDTTLLRYGAPFNYSAINNFAARHASGELLLLLNDDVEILDPDWLDEMVSWVLRPGVGIAGAKLLYPDRTIQHGGVILGVGGVAAHSHQWLPGDSPGYMGRLCNAQTISAVTGACLLTHADLFRSLNGLDAARLPVAFNDIDYCLRAREAGLRTVWTPHAVLLHHESKSRGAENTPDKQARFEGEIAWMQQRWGAQLRADPCYHPLLSLDRADFALAAQPLAYWPWLEFNSPQSAAGA